MGKGGVFAVLGSLARGKGISEKSYLPQSTQRAPRFGELGRWVFRRRILLNLAPWREKNPNPEKDCLAQSTQRTPSKNEIRGNAVGAFTSLASLAR